MSVKSERRTWYAANVEDRPALDARDPEYMAWVKRANVHMVARCVPGTAILKDAADVTAATVAAPKLRTASATDARDRIEYEGVVQAMQFAIADYMGFPGDIWSDYWKTQRHGADARHRPSLEFCKGSLKVAWPHLTEEMQRAHDEGVWRWVTFSEYKAERIAERAAEIAAYRADQEEFVAELAVAQPF